MSSVHLLLLLLLLSCSRLPTVAARTDISAQLYGNSAITRPATPSRLNAALEDLVGSVANFTRLPFNVQRTLLWSAGWVQIVSMAPFVSNTNSISKVVYVQVYVLCGRTMSDVFQSSQAFDNTSACELKNCKSNVISYTLSSCDTRYVESKTLCALSGEEIAASFESMPVKAGPLWSMDGQVDDTFEPQLFQYFNDSNSEDNVDDDGEEQRTLYLLAQKESWTMDDTTCPNGAQFIAPCRAVPAAAVDVNVQERTWCEPEIELGVKLWVNKAFTATESRSSDLESPPNVSSKIAVVLGLCLGMCVLVSVLFLIMWRRAKSWLKDGLPENEHNTFFVQAHSFQSELAPLEENGGRTGSGHCAEENELCPSLSNALQIEAINESFRMRSPELAAFCDDQELMLKRIAFAGLVYRKRMASGLHGEVWCGEYEGQQVAIKRTNASVAAITAAASASRRSLALDASALLSDKELKILVDFTKEIRMAAFLDHPNIVRFVGLSWRTLPDLCMVSEFVALGDLAHFLAQPSGKKLTWKDDKLALAADISNALVYLHSLSPVVLHRDLKSLNILLTKDLQAKLSDFGLSRETSFDGTMTRCVGTPLWTAPEVLRGERYSEKADIYSFGVVLAELDTCLLPYAYSQGRQTKGKKDRDWVPLIASGHATPMFRPDCPRALRELAAQCLDQDPSKRPPAMQIVYLLRSKIPLTL
uniref:Protein kinase domain-containing protein n=1 Tax=Hyaloperonospora arabidopsidis (strain Emoy2) TaxID=559515 RepID=M4B5Y0_HYAAE